VDDTEVHEEDPRSSGSLSDLDARTEVVLGGRVLHAAGLSDLVWGHVSRRDPRGRGIWMKASGLGFEEVTPDDVVLVADDGTVLVGQRPRHSEYRIHTELLRARPDANSVVHVHPRHAIALAAAGRPLQAFSHIGGVFAAGVRRYDGAPGLILSAAEGTAVAQALGADRALLLRGHGAVTVGASVALAVTTAVMLERACELQLLAEGFGGVLDAYDAREATRVYAHTLEDQHLLAAWAYLVRRAESAQCQNERRMADADDQQEGSTRAGQHGARGGRHHGPAA
jgi:ribulose-5-phosphate 4-epimerase/fuculose-1-phosphate aldolase